MTPEYKLLYHHMIPNFEAMKYRAGLVRPAACPMNFVKCLKSAEEGRLRLHGYNGPGGGTIHGRGQRRALEGQVVILSRAPF